MRLIRCITVVASIIIVPTASGQTPIEETTQLRFTIRPAIGESLRDSDGNQPVDESELALGVKFIRSVSDKLEFEALPELAYSPQMYDKSDPSSQLRVGFELRKRVAFGSEERILPYTSASKISAQAFTRYSPSVGFKNAFDDEAFFDNSLGAGVRFGNSVWFHCRQRWIITLGLGCDANRKVAVQFTPSVQFLKSDQDMRRRFVSQADASITVPLRDLNIRFGSRFENRRFTRLRTPSGGKQRDGRITASLSFDFAPAIPKFRRFLFGDETGRVIVNDFTLEIGARYVRNRSNDTVKNFDRIFFVPAFTYTRKLGWSNQH